MSSHSNGVILRTENLVKDYGKRTVVRDVCLELNKGEIVGLLGPNGAGKTTAFYMIVGLISADKGRILLDGQNLTALPIHSSHFIKFFNS